MQTTIDGRDDLLALANRVVEIFQPMQDKGQNGHTFELLLKRAKKCLAARADAKPAEQSDKAHTLYTTADKDKPQSILDSNGEVVLGLCKVCGAAERELSERPCTGTPAALQPRARHPFNDGMLDWHGPRADAQPGPGSETGWLIERRHDGFPEWLRVENELFTWTRDSLQAIRFCRRVDAEQVAAVIGDEVDCITDHSWG